MHGLRLYATVCLAPTSRHRGSAPIERQGSGPTPRSCVARSPRYRWGRHSRARARAAHQRAWPASPATAGTCRRVPRMTRTRVRGLAEWSPRTTSLELVAAINDVLHEYRDLLPLTLRQVFYRLVAAAGYGKTEQAYERLGETVNRGRRSGQIRFAAIRDDGVEALTPARVRIRGGLPRLGSRELRSLRVGSPARARSVSRSLGGS